MRYPTASLQRLTAASILTAFFSLTGFAAGNGSPKIGPNPTGVPNFHVVNQQVYRGGQPVNAGFSNLAKLGIKTVLDLREEGGRSTSEEKLVSSLGMHYVGVPMRGMATPAPGQVETALKVLNDP